VSDIERLVAAAELIERLTVGSYSAIGDLVSRAPTNPIGAHRNALSMPNCVRSS